MTKKKLKLAVWKFSSCDGCQLSLLDCEDQLLDIAHALDIAYFLEASAAACPGPYDISLVEGSIATEHDIERLEHIRHDSALLVALGACAVSGGVQALRNQAGLNEIMGAVYCHPNYIDCAPRSTPISAHVKVDAELRGCPVAKHQLLELVTALVQGRRPRLATGSVCLECKRAGHTCLLVSRGEPCLGPVTQAGCGALCPGLGRGCFGCFGPKDQANTASLADMFIERLGMEPRRVARLFRQVNCAAPAFAEEGERHEANHKG